MRIRLGLAMMIAALAAGGCDRKPVVECGAADSMETVATLVKEQVEKQSAAKLRGDDGARLVSLSKIRAAVNQLTVVLEDIRTSKEDPNSTKRFCTANLRVRFATDLLDDAERARAAAGEPDVSDLADSNDVERRADSFMSNVEFNIQATDDGRKVYAEAETGNALFGFTAEVLASALLRASVEEGRRAEDQASAAAAQEQEAALTAQRTANLQSARVDNQLAVQTIGATWKALTDDTRARLLPIQRAWIGKKEADCRVEAASASTDQTEREVARLTCDTRMTGERTSWLGAYRTDEVPTAAPSDSGTDM